MLPRTDTGEPRATVFTGFDETRPYLPGDNPLVGRFFKFLQYAIGNVMKGKIPRLAQVERRPQGTVSIGLGRLPKDEPGAGVSPEAIPARQSSDTGLSEMIDDIKTLLAKQERSTGLPLVRFFTTIMSGKRTDQQVKLFGDPNTRAMRDILKQTLARYADATANYTLLNLLQRHEGFQGNKPTPVARPAPKTVKPVLTNEQRDFASIINAVARFGGQPVGSAELQSLRRRWLGYPARDPTSGHPNRLSETLEKMVRAGVLQTVKGSQGGVRYILGPNAEQYRQPTAV